MTAITKTLKKIVGIMGNFNVPLVRKNASVYTFIFGNVTSGNILKLTNKGLIAPTKMSDTGYLTLRFGLSDEGWELFNSMEEEFKTFPTMTLLLLKIEKESGRFSIENREVFIKGETATAINVHDIVDGVGYRVQKSDVNSAIIKDNIEKKGTGLVLCDDDKVAEAKLLLENRVKALLIIRAKELKAKLMATLNSLKRLTPKADEAPAEPVIETPAEDEAPAENEVVVDETPATEDVAPVVEDESSNDEVIEEETQDEELEDEIVE